MAHHVVELNESPSGDGISQASQIAVGLMIITLFVLAGFIGIPKEIHGNSLIPSDVDKVDYLINTPIGEGLPQITIGTDFTKPDYQFIRRLRGV